MVQELSNHRDENAYLLGLLSDYTLAGLIRMPWGRFYRPGNGVGKGVFYGDITGLVVASGANDRGAETFARLVVNDGLFMNRIISASEQTLLLHEALAQEDSRWTLVQNRFEEYAMRLVPTDLPDEREPRLRIADMHQARAVAQGSARAMREEIEVEAKGEEFERLVRSKLDLIQRRRYYILEEAGEIRFQAYLSACLPDVGQIQGVWVPPEHRNRGIATRCLAEMCRRCLAASDHLVLRVQKRNLAALAVYRKIGFAPFKDSLSIWYQTR